MDEITSPEPPEKSLQEIHKQWALLATRRFRFLHPELTLTLYGTNGRYTLYIANCDGNNFEALAEHFEHHIRPATCDIRLSQQAPHIGVPIKEVESYEAELWLNGEPLSAQEINDLLSLAEPNLPDGGLDFDFSLKTWVFRSVSSLTDIEKSYIHQASKKIGIFGTVNIIENSPSAQVQQVTPPFQNGQNSFTIITSRRLKNAHKIVRDLAHQDEDEWRIFLSRRAKQEILKPEVTQNFACLYDAQNCGNSRLSELLTIYDRIDIIPERNGLEWLKKHQASLADLQELVRLKRIRIILPHSVSDYPSSLIEAIAEVDSSSIILSRALAAKTITQGQTKEPFLYAPLTSRQRAEILSVISKNIVEEKYQALFSSYGQIFSGQHDSFMMQGALASLGFGVGAYIGDIFFNLGNKDARIEFMTCGAGIEWALGLGASYIPRDYGGYDETRNSQIIASYMGRTKLQHTDPTSNRMHIISDGLLAVSGVPPLEVAKNFHALPASHFQKIARRLMETTPDVSELQKAVEQINADVKAFEHRIDRLASWKIQSVIEKGSLGYIGSKWGWGASIAAAWLLDILKSKLPQKTTDDLSDSIAMLTGLASGSSLDAVVVSRSKKSISIK